MKRWPKPNLKRSDKYHGVFFDEGLPEPKKWVARVNRRCAHFNFIGTFETELKAAKAYNTYVKKHELYNVGLFLNDLKCQE